MARNNRPARVLSLQRRSWKPATFDIGGEQTLSQKIERKNAFGGFIAKAACNYRRISCKE
jgi:hypothetical protein